VRSSGQATVDDIVSFIADMLVATIIRAFEVSWRFIKNLKCPI
jgi:hypothetical protein